MLGDLVGCLRKSCVTRRWYSSDIHADILNVLNAMGKKPGHKRQWRQNKPAQTPSGSISIQVIGTGAPGTPATVRIFTKQTSYLINCGENTHRLIHEAKLKGLQNIFLTRTAWKHIGGLPGMCLSLRHAGLSRITMHGPPKLKETFDAMKRFLFLNEFRVKYLEQDELYEDSILSMTRVPLQRKEDNTNAPAPMRMIEENNIDYYAHDRGEEGKLSSTMTVQRFLSKSNESIVMAYVCKFKDIPGSKKLGNNVVNLKTSNRTNGLTGTARTLGESSSPAVLFIDVPSRSFLDSLRECRAFEEFQRDDSSYGFILIVHFTPVNIVNSEEYKDFISKFPSTTKHWFINESNRSSGFIAAHRLQWQLNLLDADIFPILKKDIEPSTSEGTNERTAILPHTTYHLLSSSGVGILDRSEELIIQPNIYIDEVNKYKEFTQSLSELKRAQEQIAKPNPCSRNDEYPKFVFLGTGSCPSTQRRNMSGILVHLTNSGSILMDCAEGIAGQIHRFYGPKADEIFRNIKCIAISHLHCDHHLGLIGVLQERRRVLGDTIKPILLLAPSTIRSWLDFYEHRVESISREYTLIDNCDLISNTLCNDKLLDLGLESINTCLVQHCPHAYGFSFTIDAARVNGSKPIKVTYSGDTMPCKALVDLGYDSTVLIHEATFGDDRNKIAVRSAHSTVSQALQQGHRMNAKFILLTHFSQRYKDISHINCDLKNFGIAFDNMELVLSDLNRLSMIYPAMEKMLRFQHETKMP